MIITQDLLEMLFEESGGDFDAWVASSGYSAGWTDQQIYNALPEDIQALIGDIVMNASWYHGGM